MGAPRIHTAGRAWFDPVRRQTDAQRRWVHGPLLGMDPPRSLLARIFGVKA